MSKSTKKSNLSAKARASTRKIYMDFAASVAPNPNSIHAAGVKAREDLEKARAKVADILGTQKGNVIFTSGATESNNIAIQGVVVSYHENFYNVSELPHIITTNIEHPSVLETFKILEKRKLAEISIVPVETDGMVDPKKIKKEIKKHTILVSVMYANNEIGVIEPIKEIVKEIRHFRKNQKSNFPIFHTDATQAINYLDINVERLGVDLLSFSGSKIEGAGKTGVLFKRKNISIANIFGGGDQEFGIRPGTENLPDILKLVSALDHVAKIKEKESKRLSVLRDYFINKIPKGFVINGSRENRLPNNINISHFKIPSDLLVIELSACGVMVSSKSACKSTSKGGSYVIEAINPKADKEIGGIRFSFGINTTKKDIDYVLSSLNKILIKLKKWYN